MDPDYLDKMVEELYSTVHDQDLKISKINGALKSRDITTDLERLYSLLDKTTRVNLSLYSTMLNKVFFNRYIVLTGVTPSKTERQYIGKFIRVECASIQLPHSEWYSYESEVDVMYSIIGTSATVEVEARDFDRIVFNDFEDEYSAQVFAELGD